MKQIQAFVFVILSSIQVFASNPWDYFEGCYETAVVDGHKITERTNFYKSRIKYGDDIFFTQADGSVIKAVTTAIVIKKDGTDTVIDIPLGFVTAPGSQVVTLKDGVRFEFNGVVKLKRDGKLYAIVYANEFTDLGGGRIRVINGNTKRQFELQTTPCP